MPIAVGGDRAARRGRPRGGRRGRDRARGNPRRVLGAQSACRGMASTASSRLAIAAGSVSGAASRCATGARRSSHRAVRRFCSTEPRRSPESVHVVRGCRGRPRRWSRLRPRQAAARRPLADLGTLDIGHAGRRRGQLQPRQRAESLAGRDREKRGQPPSAVAASNTSRASSILPQQRINSATPARCRTRRDELSLTPPGDLASESRSRIRRCELAGSRMSIQAAQSALFGRPTRRAGAPRQRLRRLASSSVYLWRHRAHHVATHHALGTAFARLRRILPLLRRPRRSGQRDRAVQDIGRALAGTPHIGCVGPDVAPAW